MWYPLVGAALYDATLYDATLYAKRFVYVPRISLYEPCSASLCGLTLSGRTEAPMAVLSVYHTSLISLGIKTSWLGIAKWGLTT